MDNELVVKYFVWIVLLNGLGSLVDILQFVWIAKRTYRKMKRVIYNRIKREIMAEQENKKSSKLSEEG